MSSLISHIEEIKSSREELALHSQEVSELAYQFGIQLGCTYREVKTLKIGGLVHDIGKLKQDEKILFKKGRLTNEEFEIIKEHPLVGFMLLKESSDYFNDDVLDIVLQHHERVDGTGYPNGVSGNQINKLAKIITLCDVYSAICSKRCYKGRSSKLEALNIISEGLGSHFDTDLGQKFILFMQSSDKL